mgnify:CR=1 FL=1
MIVGVTGGKGGTGKSTIATALAYELGQSSKVLLVDADVDCPNDHLLLGIERSVLRSVRQRIPTFGTDRCNRCGRCADVCRMNAIIVGKDPVLFPAQCNGCGACQIICATDAIRWSEKAVGTLYTGNAHSIELLSGELLPNEPMSETIVHALLGSMNPGNYDHVIIDTAAGTHCPVVAALKPCERIFLVTEPTPFGKHDLGLMQELIERIGKQASIILNRSDIDTANIDAEWHIPHTKEIAAAYASGKPAQHPTIKKIVESL